MEQKYYGWWAIFLGLAAIVPMGCVLIGIVLLLVGIYLNSEDTNKNTPSTTRKDLCSLLAVAGIVLMVGGAIGVGFSPVPAIVGCIWCIYLWFDKAAKEV